MRSAVVLLLVPLCRASTNTTSRRLNASPSDRLRLEHPTLRKRSPSRASKGQISDEDKAELLSAPSPSSAAVPARVALPPRKDAEAGAASSIPSFMYGTAWKEARTAMLARLALDKGFSALDTATAERHYSERGVGDALRGPGAPGRDALFLQTKFTYPRGHEKGREPWAPTDGPEQRVTHSLDRALANLAQPAAGGYVDALLLHGPSSEARSRGLLSEEDRATWRGLEAELAAGRTRAIGVCNVDANLLRQLIDDAEAQPPMIVQNRCYASSGWDYAVRRLCREHGIVYEGYSLLTANRRAIANPRGPIKKAAARLGVTDEAVVFRFAMQLGIVPLTGTSSEEHMVQDRAAYGVELTAPEVAAIETCFLNNFVSAS